MATNEVPAADAASPIRIRHVMVRVDANGAQTLEVVGDLPDDRRLDDLWVAIGLAAPADMAGEGFRQRVEAARRLEPAEIDRLPLSAGLRAELAAPARTPWFARFDFSDHRELQDDWGPWHQRAAAGPLPTIDVLAWLAQSGGAVDAAVAPSRRAVPMNEVVPRSLFELGILFVHGIGPHRVRQTLLRFGEPLVDFWLQLMRRHRAVSAAALGHDGAEQLRRRAARRVVRAREDEDGAKRVVDRLVAAAPPAPGRARGPAAPARPDLACAWMRTEDTLLADERSDAPSATVMRLMRLDHEAGLHDSHVLLAEAWWVREAEPPRRAELLAWLKQAIPLALVMHVGALVDQRPGRPSVVGWCQPDDAARAVGLRLNVERVLWALKLLLLVPLYTALASLRQVGVGALSLLVLLPLPGVRPVAQAVLDVLMGTLGQSWALQRSPVRRSAIVNRVVRQLDWLSDRCERVAIVAHSQGAEVTRLALQMRRRREVQRWVTLGAGIRPLLALERDHPSQAEQARVLPWLLAPSSVLLAATGGLALLSAWPGLVPAWAARLAAGWPVVGQAALMAVAVSAVSVVLTAATRGFHDLKGFRGRLSILQGWHDYFASNDPVPGGSMLRDLEHDLKPLHQQQALTELPREHEVHNHRFGLLDHTSYFDNLEQFVAPLGLDLLRFAGLQGEPEATRRVLAAAHARRAAYTWRHHAVRSAVLLALPVLLLLMATGHVGHVVEPARQAWLAASGATGTWDAVHRLWADGHAGRLVRAAWPLWPPLALWLASWAWKRAREKASCTQLLDDLAAAWCQGPPAAAPRPPTP